MRKSRVIRTVLGIIILGALVFARAYFRVTNSGKPVSIQMNGVEVKVNDTKVQELVDKGYTLGNGSLYELKDTVEAKSYTSEVGCFIKEHQKYADFAVANHSGSSEDIKTCKIISMEFFYGGEFIMGKTINTYEDAIINGFNPKGMTKDQIKAKLTQKITEEDSKKIRVEDGDYYCQYNFSTKGTLYSVEVGIPGSKIKTS